MFEQGGRICRTFSEMIPRTRGSHSFKCQKAVACLHDDWRQNDCFQPLLDVGQGQPGPYLFDHLKHTVSLGHEYPGQGDCAQYWASSEGQLVGPPQLSVIFRLI